jgi:putative chitinase
MRLQPDQWERLLRACGVKAGTANLWGEIFAEEVDDSTFSAGVADLADFLPTILVESMHLERMEESLNYSAERIVQVWESRFPTVNEAQPFARSPEALANKVYGGRMGNNLMGDGWRYRGRSPIQITGKANYERVGDLMGQNLVGIPDLLSQPRFALEACIAWWEDKIPDSMLGETTSIRKRVNGGTLGLAEVKALTTTVKKALAAEGVLNG